MAPPERALITATPTAVTVGQGLRVSGTDCRGAGDQAHVGIQGGYDPDGGNVGP